MASMLAQLRKVTTVVADTGDIDAIRQHQPQDATTNPSLLLKAVNQPDYQPFIQAAVEWARSNSKDPRQQLIDACDKLAVIVGSEILKLVPGRVSTEVDARLSFDTQGTIDRARKLIALYQKQDVDPERILIKIASTWEGIRAAEVLESEGIHCNLTLLFHIAQAQAAAEAGATLISPFVGRILDWYKKHTGCEGYAPSEDPGVISVTQIYRLFKTHEFSTIVMGASFRNSDEILELAGCDLLTISPTLLAELDAMPGELITKLSHDGEVHEKPTPLTESRFRWDLNQDPMATEKLAEGIRNFTADQEKLEQMISRLL